MGHNVQYLGKLTPKTRLNDKEKELFEKLRDDYSDYDRLYALEYNGEDFVVDDSNEKIYPEPFFAVIEKYIAKLKEGGNDIKNGCYLVSCSEYGLDEEAIVMSYKDGGLKKVCVLDIIKDWANENN